MIDSLDSLIEEVSGEVERRLATLRAELKRLSTIPGVSTRISQAMLSEMGADMGRFASAGHLASWVAICPGHDESAGKSRSGRTRKGSPWLRSALVQAAKAAGRTQTYLGAQYRRIAARRGANRAAVAVAHSIIVIAYYMLKRGEDYRDLGGNYFDDRQHDQVKRRLTRRLEALGYSVQLTPDAA